MSDLLYSAAQIRELDRIAIDEMGIPGLTLMRRAATACLALIQDLYPQGAVRVYCGSGNNAGDGYILAGMLAERGRATSVVRIGDHTRLGEDATRGYEWCLGTGVVMVEPDAIRSGPEATSGDDPPALIVDALLGTGVTGEVRPAYREAIEQINDSSAPVVAVDVPSGLCSDTGTIRGAAVRADHTVTFIGCKRGLLTAEGVDRAGTVTLADLRVPPEIYARIDHPVARLDWITLAELIRPRARNSHKGRFGHLLIVGGDAGMPGAVAMAAEAALMTGAGLISVATRAEHAAPIISRCPEVMVRGVANGDALAELIANATALVVGPGLGRSDWSRDLLSKALASDLPMVLDADGLNLLEVDAPSAAPRVYTPHPGEAMRLLGRPVQGDRFAAVAELQAMLGGVALLKGAGTLIQDASGCSLCPYGNPGMSVAGMGDVLSGVIGSLLAQGHPPGDAARLGAVLHARAGDARAALTGERGLRATELIPAMRELINRMAEMDVQPADGSGPPPMSRSTGVRDDV